MTIKTSDELEAYVSEIEQTKGYRRPLGFGICRVERGRLRPENILSCSFPVPNWGTDHDVAAIFQKLTGLIEQDISGCQEIVTSVSEDFIWAALDIFTPLVSKAEGEKNRNIQVLSTLNQFAKSKKINFNHYRLVFVYADEAPESVSSIYLKLLALSTGAAPLRSLNLDGIFGKLQNVAWIKGKPYELDWLRRNEISQKLLGKFQSIDAVDKFPRYLDHVIPDERTRILDAGKVRLGAQLAAGTTVMPGASYINFNAGTLGPVMVEGRISSNVVVGEGTDIGGGASILGVLSGGNKIPVTIGQNCLLGANSVTGTSLGNGCIVDAGTTVLAGTRVYVTQAAKIDLAKVNPGSVFENSLTDEFKASSLIGCNNMHFRMDSRTGRMHVIYSKRQISLNADLH